MTIIQLSNLFDAVAASTLGLSSYWFGWPSDRVRPRATNDTTEQAGALFPRLLFAVPTVEQDPRTKKDYYNVQLFFDDLLGYDNDGEADDQTQLQKWRNLMNTATAWLKTLESSLPSLRPDGVMIEGNPRFTLDSFSGMQRLISVVVDLRIATNTSCGAVIDFPAAIPSGIPWPPADVVVGQWVKSEQQFDETTSAVLAWTANNFDLTGAWSFDVYMQGQKLLPEQYTLGASTITIDALTHYDGATYYVRGLWTV
jgi:hypothetical protein